MITFSLITITYNAARVLPPTLESVKAQTYERVEHIIVDGASYDDTMAQVSAYRKESGEAENGHEIMAISEPDKGIYDAMNKGLAMATGDYICFLNAGDRLPETDTLNLLAQMAEESGDGERPAVIYGDTDIVDNDGRRIGRRHLAAPEKLNWRSFRKGMLVCHQAFYARRDIAQGIPYDLRFRLSADVDWCIKVMKEAAHRHLSLKNAHHVIAHYLQEGQTTLHHQASLNERFQVMRRHYGLATTVIMHIWFVLRKPFIGKP